LLTEGAREAKLSYNELLYLLIRTVHQVGGNVSITLDFLNGPKALIFEIVGDAVHLAVPLEAQNENQSNG